MRREAEVAAIHQSQPAERFQHRSPTYTLAHLRELARDAVELAERNPRRHLDWSTKEQKMCRSQQFMRAAHVSVR